MIKFTLSAGALLTGLAVGFGAFGAHALEEFLIAQGRLDTYQTAVQYQFYHALGMLFTGLLLKQSPQAKWLKYAAVCLFLGILFFSGSLYILCFTGLGILGAITPIGGVLFIFAWLFVALTVLKSNLG